MAKFKLENLPEGVIVCRILEVLNKNEASQIIKGIEKVLANGKARIILEFLATTSQGEVGADFFEKSLRPLKMLAKKMRGDLLYVVPDPEGQKVFGSIGDLKTAVRTLLGQQGDSGKEKTVLLQELESLKIERNKLKTENKFLEEKVGELIKIVSQPSTDEELKQGIVHYRTLAAELEVAPPAQPGKPEKTKSGDQK